MTGTLSNTDLGLTDDRWHCVQTKTIENYLSAGYWAFKTYEWLAGIP